MKTANNFFKMDPLVFAKRMIEKQFPKLAEKEFEIRQKGVACESCRNNDHYNRFGRRYSNLVQVYEIKIQDQNEWRDVPLKQMICRDCEAEKLAIEARQEHERLKIDKATKPFWIIPRELEMATIDNYGPMDPATAEAKEIAIKFIKEFQEGDQYSLIFRGSYGGGKSHLLKGIAETIKTLYKPKGDPYTVGFIPMENVLTMIKGTWGSKGETQNEWIIIQQLIDLDFLVLDDVGSEGGEWAGKKLFEIINGRMGKATGITTNYLDMDELAERFGSNGGKIASRLHSNTKIFDLTTTDKRSGKTR